jgi:elongation factor 1-gamma
MPSSQPPLYTLYVPEASFRAFAILIAAEINGVEVTVETKDLATGLAVSKTGKLPVLVWKDADDQDGPHLQQQHSISSSAAIARYIAAARTDTNLCGNSQYDRAAQIDMWLDWNLTELELPCTVWFYPAVGYMTYQPRAYEKAKIDVAAALQVLETALSKSQSQTSSSSSNNYFLVGSHLTLADISIVATLLYPFKFVCDETFRTPFPHVINWFQRCVRMPAFARVVGDNVILCQKEQLPPPSAQQQREFVQT